jgi:hypothetical protein
MDGLSAMEFKAKIFWRIITRGVRSINKQKLIKDSLFVIGFQTLENFLVKYF